MIDRVFLSIIKAYKHSKIITEFSEDLWNGLLDKYLVFQDHIEIKIIFLFILYKIFVILYNELLYNNDNSIQKGKNHV